MISIGKSIKNIQSITIIFPSLHDSLELNVIFNLNIQKQNKKLYINADIDHIIYGRIIKFNFLRYMLYNYSK